MADVKISQLTAASETDVIDSTIIPIVSADDDTTKKLSLSLLKSAYFCDIQCASLSIASADVLTLNSVPLEIVAAPGAGYALEVLSASFKISYNTTAYATNTTLTIGSSGGGEVQGQFSSGLAHDVSGHWTNFSKVTAGTSTTQMLENAALNVSVKSGDPTAGDSDIEVFVLYRVITL